MSTSRSIPLPYRILLLYFEPAAAFNGFILAHFYPKFYLAGMSPSAIVTTYNASTQIIFDQLAACYFLFAWNEAVTLRCTNDIQVWKAVVLGILLCDVFHLYATWAALGGAFWDPRLWRMEDWINFVMLYGPGSLRAAFLLDFGMGKGTESIRKKEM
ncbi:hypothetical protein MMC19_007488 [Ptychographa xylographoides]|nr:hypothetical protein [Ptychographa xylographoides]